MSPRRNSTNPGYTPPRPTNGHVGGRPPLTLVTNQKPFCAATAQAVETESPQSGTFPQDIQDASMPPRPLPFPRLLPPRNSGPRRRSIRIDTEETLSPASESPSQSQPPPPLIRSQKPAPGEGVGEFATVPPPRHGPGHEYSHRYTTDCSYRFDTIPSRPSDSSPSYYKSEDISGGTHAHVWPIYNKISQEFDEKLFSKWNTDLDVLLIFVSLLLDVSP